MREIKFRVWDATLKRLFYPKAPLYVTGSDWPHVAGRIDFKGVWPTTDVSYDEEGWMPSVLEQYTGLKDREGKEIYEGDVIEHIIPDCCYGAGKKARGIVFGRPWAFGIEPINYHGDLTCMGDRMTYGGPDPIRSVVIGNIHENPELLKPNE